jgi:hypothetical protein
MENKMMAQSQDEMRRLICSQAFLATPVWGEFFYYAKDRESLMDLYEALMDQGFRSVAQPHMVGPDAFVAKLIDPKGRHIFLRCA